MKLWRGGTVPLAPSGRWLPACVLVRSVIAVGCGAGMEPTFRWGSHGYAAANPSGAASRSPKTPSAGERTPYVRDGATVWSRMSSAVADSGTVQANTSLAMAPKPRLFFLSTCNRFGCGSGRWSRCPLQHNEPHHPKRRQYLRADVLEQYSAIDLTSGEIWLPSLFPIAPSE